jgi:hypothetical protein
MQIITQVITFVAIAMYFRRRTFRSCRAIAASPYGILCLSLTLLRTSNSGIRLARYRSAAILILPTGVSFTAK